jgi:hypothetical protein
MIKRYALAAMLGLLTGITAGYLSGCTPAQQATATSAGVLSAKIGACVQAAIAEEEERRARDARLAEIEAEQEAERIREETAEAAREHSPTTKEEIDKVLRDGGTK